MAFATKTWNVGDVLTAADLDTYVRDPLDYLHGDAGDIALGGASNLTLGGNLRVETGTFRVHRHPYGNERHLESGTVLITTGSNNAASASAAFTNAFGATPVVMATAQFVGNAPVSGVPAYASSISTTGATIWAAPGNGWTSEPVAWLAEGQD